MKKYTVGPSDKQGSGFIGRDLDPHELQQQRQFMEQLEMAVALANREVIHKLIPNLNKQTFQQLAVMVARLRASYLEAAIKMSVTQTISPEALEELKSRRDLFEQGRAAFEALERAIERGYVDIKS
jgi:hypothetical protein